ncbi:MAG: hypothetical protein OXJ63_02505 [Gammaproteobacteria bacterium]|nr:hypothetical protein [Gammaproteobacteria bacterium]
MGRNRKAKVARGRRNRRRAPTLRVVREAEELFRTAILAGLLSAERSDPRWAGHYMYMFHDEDGTGWFKHRDTRAYLPFPARRQAAARAPGECGT